MGVKGRASIAIVCMAVAACGSGHATGVANTSASAARASTSSPASRSPIPLATPSPLSATGPCRLPIADSSEAHGWFITYPGSVRQDDPTSVVALPGGAPGQVGGNPGLTYDRAAGVWVPVPYEWVAPQGAVYTYEDFQSGAIYAVSVPEGKVSQVTATTGNWYLIDTEDNGVYVTKNGTSGAWFIPFGGQASQVVDHGSWQKFFAGALWGIDPTSGHLVQHVMSTGADKTWTDSGHSEIKGFDWYGNPLVGTDSLVLVHSNGSTVTLWSGPGTAASGRVISGRALGDARGVWFEVGGASIYLWTPQGGAKLIAASDLGHVAGGCW